MKKIGIFWDEIIDSSLSERDKYVRVGLNSGNMVFIRSLKSILHPTILPRWTMGDSESALRYFNAEEYDAFVTTELIWITPNAEYPHVWQALKRIGDKPLVPISVGLQNRSTHSHFAFAKDTINLLKAIEERAVIGVRGEYTASVLQSHGIKRMKVIGCPSVFYGLKDRIDLKLADKEPKNSCCNFRTFYNALSIPERHFLTYAANHRWEFVEQTAFQLQAEHVHSDMSQFRYLNQWLSHHEHVFFDPDLWADWIKTFDFSIGSRFHGNVIALTNGIPALTMPVDSRMDEMASFFHIPTMSMKDFDMTKPVSYYYEKADPTEFNHYYPQRLANFKSFLNENQLL
jgi:hypothetical protein